MLLKKTRKRNIKLQKEKSIAAKANIISLNLVVFLFIIFQLSVEYYYYIILIII